ncbi:MAG: hypothetical protein ACLTW9_02625 [Enterocloster sp.]
MACLGNGFNDIQMFDAAQLSIAVLGAGGYVRALLSHASVVVRSIEDGLDLLLKPDRLRGHTEKLTDRQAVVLPCQGMNCLQ